MWPSVRHIWRPGALWRQDRGRAATADVLAEALRDAKRRAAVFALEPIAVELPFPSQGLCRSLTERSFPHGLVDELF